MVTNFLSVSKDEAGSILSTCSASCGSVSSDSNILQMFLGNQKVVCTRNSDLARRVCDVDECVRTNCRLNETWLEPWRFGRNEQVCTAGRRLPKQQVDRGS